MAMLSTLMVQTLTGWFLRAGTCGPEWYATAWQTGCILSFGSFWIGFVCLALPYGFNFEYKKPTLIRIE
jgi:hypothetical protein